MDFQTYAAQELAAVAHRLADAARKELETATAQLTATCEASVDRLRTDQSQLVIENERLTAENAALSWEKNELLDAAGRSSRAALVDRLLEVFGRIGESTTVDAVLLATASGLTADFGRVAVFTGGERVVQLGAEPPLDSHSNGVVAVPMIVRGETLAVIYAADETRPDGEGPRLADLLRDHATLTLERLTVELKTIAELRAYAQMLLDEVAYVFEADTAAKMKAADRSGRLKENLKCARQIYHQRVTLEGPAAASVLDAVLAEIIQAKADTLFGRELAALESPKKIRSRPNAAANN